MEVLKDEAAYIAVEGNQSGSRPRELFEDVLEDAEKAYADDRALMKVGMRACSRACTIIKFLLL